MLSVFVALRDKGRCRWCAGQKPEPMGASHFFPRGRWGTRYEPANLMWMHNSCNARAERERGASYRALMTTALGQAQFDVLAAAASARVVPTRAWLLAQKAKAEALVRSVLP